MKIFSEGGGRALVIDSLSADPEPALIIEKQGKKTHMQRIVCT